MLQIPGVLGVGLMQGRLADTDGARHRWCGEVGRSHRRLLPKVFSSSPFSTEPSRARSGVESACGTTFSCVFVAPCGSGLTFV
jgi:hypothetical protein